MDLRIQLLAIIASAGLLLFVLELVRRTAAASSATRCCGCSARSCCSGCRSGRALLEGSPSSLGIAYPPNALFLIAFGFVLLLLLHFSLAVSRLSDQTKVLAQRLGLVEQRLVSSEQRREHRRRQLDAGGDIQNGGSEVEEYAEARE